VNLNKRFPKKRIIITGAGSGLGRALALEFAKLKWNIAIAEISKPRGEESVELVKKAGGDAMFIHCDVTKPDDFEKALKVLKQKWGGVDILVNNAGVSAGGFMEKIPIEKWAWIMDLNVNSVIYGCRTFIPHFKENKSGYIINIASNAGISSLPEMSSYNVSKAAVISLSETLRIELKKSNIGVSVVCPTFFRTNLMDQFHSTDERQALLAKRAFELSRTSSEKIAKHIISSIKCTRLYIITQFDGKFSWFMKRHYPEWYYRFLGWFYSKGYLDRLLGVTEPLK
jgi:NAD(P)-dependent dehydrogenase (short-subunit alcohol dehydrogenase family)